MKYLIIVAVMCGSLFSASRAVALPWTGRVIGEWSGVVSTDPADEREIINRDAGESALFRWGNPGGSQSVENRLVFDGVGSDGEGGWLVEPGNTFRIGDLLYQNGRTYHSIGITGVDLVLTIDLSYGSAQTLTTSHTVHFSIVNTPNSGGNPASDADTISVESVFLNSSFHWNGLVYTLELTGFSQDGGLSSATEFTVEEDRWSSSGLYARFSPEHQPIPQPEPGTFVLLLLGMGGVWCFRRSKPRSVISG